MLTLRSTSTYSSSSSIDRGIYPVSLSSCSSSFFLRLGLLIPTPFLLILLLLLILFTFSNSASSSS